MAVKINGTNSSVTLKAEADAGGYEVVVPKQGVGKVLQVVETYLTTISTQSISAGTWSNITDLNDFSQYKTIIKTTIKNLKNKNPYMEPKSYPKTPDVIDVFPSNGVLYTIEDEFIGKAWLRILNTVNSYGNKTWTSHDSSSEVRECVNVVSVIYREDPDNPKMEEYFRFSKDDIMN